MVYFLHIIFEQMGGWVKSSQIKFSLTLIIFYCVF